MAFRRKRRHRNRGEGGGGGGATKRSEALKLLREQSGIAEKNSEALGVPVTSQGAAKWRARMRAARGNSIVENDDSSTSKARRLLHRINATASEDLGTLDEAGEEGEPKPTLVSSGTDDAEKQYSSSSLAGSFLERRAKKKKAPPPAQEDPNRPSRLSTYMKKPVQSTRKSIMTVDNPLDASNKETDEEKEYRRVRRSTVHLTNKLGIPPPPAIPPPPTVEGEAEKGAASPPRSARLSFKGANRLSAPPVPPATPMGSPPPKSNIIVAADDGGEKGSPGRYDFKRNSVVGNRSAAFERARGNSVELSALLGKPGKKSKIPPPPNDAPPGPSEPASGKKAGPKATLQRRKSIDRIERLKKLRSKMEANVADTVPPPPSTPPAAEAEKTKKAAALPGAPPKDRDSFKQKSKGLPPPPSQDRESFKQKNNKKKELPPSPRKRSFVDVKVSTPPSPKAAAPAAKASPPSATPESSRQASRVPPPPLSSPAARRKPPAKGAGGNKPSPAPEAPGTPDSAEKHRRKSAARIERIKELKKKRAELEEKKKRSSIKVYDRVSALKKTLPPEPKAPIRRLSQVYTKDAQTMSVRNATGNSLFGNDDSFEESFDLFDYFRTPEIAQEGGETKEEKAEQARESPILFLETVRPVFSPSHTQALNSPIPPPPPTPPPQEEQGASLSIDTGDSTKTGEGDMGGKVVVNNPVSPVVAKAYSLDPRLIGKEKDYHQNSTFSPPPRKVENYLTPTQRDGESARGSPMSIDEEQSFSMASENSEAMEQFEKFGQQDELRSITLLRDAWSDNHAQRMAELEAISTKLSSDRDYNSLHGRNQYGRNPNDGLPQGVNGRSLPEGLISLDDVKAAAAKHFPSRRRKEWNQHQPGHSLGVDQDPWNNAPAVLKKTPSYLHGTVRPSFAPTNQVIQLNTYPGDGERQFRGNGNGNFPVFPKSGTRGYTSMGIIENYRKARKRAVEKMRQRQNSYIQLRSRQEVMTAASLPTGRDASVRYF